MKTAVIFPGIGYTCEKPLLYYAAKLAAAEGYRIIRVSYHDMPAGAKGNPEKMTEAFHTALKQADEQIPEETGDCPLFISKSIGTAAAVAYAHRHGLNAAHILFTPVDQTFLYAEQIRAIAFHGTGDPWAKTENITSRCSEAGIPLCITEGANHSLETGNVDADLRTLCQVMETVRTFIRNL